LIAIPVEIEECFRSYAALHPEEESHIARVIEFRQRVREEFDRLVGEIRIEPMSSQSGKEIPTRYAKAGEPILSAQAPEFRWAQPVKPNCL